MLCLKVLLRILNIFLVNAKTSVSIPSSSTKINERNDQWLQGITVFDMKYKNVNCLTRKDARCSTCSVQKD